MNKTSHAQLEANRRYYQKNKEKVNLMKKSYREKNKDYFDEYAKSYREKNREKSIETSKKWRESKKDGFFYVYCLPNANYYIGQTSNLHTRMWQHNKIHKRDASDFIILHKCDTQEEALFIESTYHKLGFLGARSND